jgi:integrase
MENGKRKTVSLKTKNIREAEKKAKELRGDIAELKTKEDYLTKIATNRRLMKLSSIKLENGWKHYIDTPADDKPNSSSGTLENYCRNYKEFVDWMKVQYPEVSCISDAITVDMAREYWQSLKNKALSPNTLNYKRGALLLIFRVLQQEAGLSSNVWQKIPRARVTKRGQNGLDGTQAKRRAIHFYESVNLLKVFNESSFKLMHKEQMQTLFSIGIFTGLRLIDAVNLKWQYIKDVTGGQLIELYPRKTLQFNKKVSIPVTPQLQVELERAKIDNESEFVIPAVVERYGRNPSGVNGDCLKVFRKAGYTTTVDKGQKQRVNNIAFVGFHSLRSSLFSYLAGRGLTVEKLAEISGDSVQTLSKYYLKLEQAELAKSVRGAMETDKRLSAAFDSVINVDAQEVPHPSEKTEREQLKTLADIVDIEKVRKALEVMSN